MLDLLASKRFFYDKVRSHFPLCGDIHVRNM